jgi:methylphosphotriester-DNA--protein-cysteine methyltransferase
MPLTCPVCRAVNEQPSACRRCKADLSLCWSVLAQREYHVAAAKAALARHDLKAAAYHLDEAEVALNGSDLHRLRAVWHLLRRDFESAWKEAQLVRSVTNV